MSNHLYLPDTSIWIDLFRPRAPPLLANRIRSLGVSEQLAFNQVIRLELLHGARNPREYGDIDDELLGWKELRIAQSTWDLAASLGFELRRKGVTASLPDLIIAMSAIEHGAVLIHVNGIFPKIAGHSDLHIESYAEAQI